MVSLCIQFNTKCDAEKCMFRYTNMDGDLEVICLACIQQWMIKDGSDSDWIFFYRSKNPAHTPEDIPEHTKHFYIYRKKQRNKK